MSQGLVPYVPDLFFSLLGAIGGQTLAFDIWNDSRLAAGTVSYGSTALDEQYHYNHLGQRIMKEGDSVSVYFICDIFGNMIGGVATWAGGCSVSKGIVQSAKSNWVVILVLPVIVLLGIKYRRNRLLVGLLVIIGGGVIIIVAMNEAHSTLTYSEAIYYYHNDHLGTPQVMTDEYGDVVWDAAYEPFGKINTYATQSITNRHRFPGQYEDDMTGMYYNWNRHYMPEGGRYNRVDPYGQYFTPYDYVYNNPFRFADPKGLGAVPKLPPQLLYLIEGGGGQAAGSFVGNLLRRGCPGCLLLNLLWPSDLGSGMNLYELGQWGLGNQNGLNNVIMGPWPNPPGSQSPNGNGDPTDRTICWLVRDFVDTNLCVRYCSYQCENGAIFRPFPISQNDDCEPCFFWP